MIKINLSRAAFLKYVTETDCDDLARFQYCYWIGSTFVSLSLMEESVIDAMAICNRVRIASVLGADATWWETYSDKNGTLQKSTLGNLIKILSRHAIAAGDLHYLLWLKGKRDLFIHRLFRGGEWPGDLDPDGCEIMIRRLAYLEIIFQRAAIRIWKVLARAKLMILDDLGENGMLMMNHEIFEDDDAP